MICLQGFFVGSNTRVKYVFQKHFLKFVTTQLIFSCLKSTVKTLGKGVKYIQVNN